MRSHAKKTAYYRYPVELVWRAIGAGERRELDPLTEEEFENQEPEPNTIFTRLLEMEENRVFAFRMKARGFVTDMRIELESVAPCETLVRLSQDVTYRSAAVYMLSGFGTATRRELKSFAMDLGRRLADGMR